MPGTCGSCGAELPEDSDTCGQCGADNSGDAEPGRVKGGPKLKLPWERPRHRG